MTKGPKTLEIMKMRCAKMISTLIKFMVILAELSKKISVFGKFLSALGKKIGTAFGLISTGLSMLGSPLLSSSAYS